MRKHGSKEGLHLHKIPNRSDDEDNDSDVDDGAIDDDYQLYNDRIK
jgi:hypothetical protein